MTLRIVDLVLPNIFADVKLRADPGRLYRDQNGADPLIPHVNGVNGRKMVLYIWFLPTPTSLGLLGWMILTLFWRHDWPTAAKWIVVDRFPWSS